MTGSLKIDIEYRWLSWDLFTKSLRAAGLCCLVFSFALETGHAADPITTGVTGNVDPVITGAVVPPITEDDLSGCTEILLENESNIRSSEVEVCPYLDNGEVDYDRCEVAAVPCTIIAVCPGERGQETRVETGSYSPYDEGTERFTLVNAENQEAYTDISEEFRPPAGFNAICFFYSPSGQAAALGVAAAGTAGVIAATSQDPPGPVTDQ